MEQEGREDNVVCAQLYCTRPSSGETVCEPWPLLCLCSVLFLLSESSRSPASLSRSLSRSLFLSLRPSWLSLSLRLLRFLLSFRSLFLHVPGHLFFLTRQSLTSEISGQGLPKGDGYCRTCLVRVSWPRLKPQVLPDREQGLQSLHSPTSQCTCGVHSISLSLGS